MRDRHERGREALRAWAREALSKGLCKAATKRCAEALASDMLRRWRTHSGKRGLSMAIEKVRAYLAEHDMADRILEFEVSSATVELAAQAAGVEPERIAKTLSFHVSDRVALIVAAGDARIDNQKYKAQFHTKAKMLKAEEAEQLIGHAVGGVCPFAVNDGCDIYLDATLRRFETVFPACGSANSAIELTPNELEELCAPCTWVDVCKLPA